MNKETKFKKTGRKENPKNPLRPVIAIRLKTARKESGSKMEIVAYELGMQYNNSPYVKSVISNFENLSGRKTPNEQQLRILSDIYNVSYDWLSAKDFLNTSLEYFVSSSARKNVSAKEFLKTIKKHNALIQCVQSDEELIAYYDYVKEDYLNWSLYENNSEYNKWLESMYELSRLKFWCPDFSTMNIENNQYGYSLNDYLHVLISSFISSTLLFTGEIGIDKFTKTFEDYLSDNLTLIGLYEHIDNKDIKAEVINKVLIKEKKGGKQNGK